MLHFNTKKNKTYKFALYKALTDIHTAVRKVFLCKIYRNAQSKQKRIESFDPIP